MDRLTSESTRIKASSLVKENSADYVGRNVFSGDLSTCWSSDSGSPQFVLVDFQTAVRIAEVRIMFQGGFAGTFIFCPILLQRTTFITFFDLDRHRNDMPSRTF